MKHGARDAWQRRVWRVPTPADGIITKQMQDDATANNCAEIEFRIDAKSAYLYTEDYPALEASDS